MVHSFYRQGEFFDIPVSNPTKVVFGDMYDLDIGQMFLVYNKVIVARSSKNILFFK